MAIREDVDLVAVAVEHQAAAVERLAHAWTSVRDLLKEVIPLSQQAEDSQLLFSKTLKENLMDVAILTKALADANAATNAMATAVKDASAEIAALAKQISDASGSDPAIQAFVDGINKNTTTLNAAAAELEAVAKNPGVPTTTTTGTGGTVDPQAL